MKKALWILAGLCVLCLQALAAEGEWIYQEETELSYGELRWFSDERLREIAPDGKTVWQSTNESAATVDRWGNVQAAKTDSLAETFIVAERDGVAYSWKVTVRPLSQQILLYAGDEPLTEHVLDLDAGQTGLQIRAVVLPEGAEQGVEYTLRGDGASIDGNGFVHVLQDGRYKIQARATDRGRATAECTVLALHPVRSISIIGGAQVTSGQSIRLSAGFEPQNATIKDLEWTSADSSIASVDESGNVTGGNIDAVAQTLITATARDGSGVFCTWPVTVVPAAQRLELLLDGESFSPQALILDDSMVGKVLEFSAQVLPVEAAQAVKWTSSNKDIIKVDQQGHIGVVGRGTCSITIEAQDGSGVERILYVAVGDTDKLPYYLEVDKGNQVVRAYEKDENGLYTVLSRRMVCSTGVYDRAFANGLYDVDSARHEWMGTILEGVYCQYGVRFYDQIWFHSLPYAGTNASRMDMDAYAQLGTRASHGCIRLLCADAKWIYENVPGGSWMTVCICERVESEYGAVSWPQAQGGWDPTDESEKNPYFDPSYTSAVSKE